MKPILVTSYINPDLDGCACAIAYGELLQKIGNGVIVGIIGQLDDETKYILNRFNFEYPPIILNDNNFDDVILVDTSDIYGLKGKISPEKVIEIIDHRGINEINRFSRAKTQIELVGAAATLIAEKFIQNKIDISITSATLLYGAIISNTINFKSSVTTNRDEIAADWLNRLAKLPRDFWKDLFIAKSDLTDKKLNKRIEDDFTCFMIGKKKIGIAQLEVIGAKELIKKRSNKIVQSLEKIKKEMILDFIFLNTIELENPKNFFITQDSQTQSLLEKIFSIEFNGSVAVYPKLVLRKQIVPLLKEELDKSPSSA
jgi:manganese-dependent inorganic pyrophosphatase